MGCMFAGLREAMEANFVTELIPGGSGQNTARMVQWLFGVPRCTTVLACIGKDSTGRELARYTRGHETIRRTSNKDKINTSLDSQSWFLLSLVVL